MGKHPAAASTVAGFLLFESWQKEGGDYGSTHQARKDSKAGKLWSNAGTRAIVTRLSFRKASSTNAAFGQERSYFEEPSTINAMSTALLLPVFNQLLPAKVGEPLSLRWMPLK